MEEGKIKPSYCGVEERVGKQGGEDGGEGNGRVVGRRSSRRGKGGDGVARDIEPRILYKSN